MSGPRFSVLRDEAELDAALGDAGVLRRFRGKCWLLAESQCVWWVGAVSGAGHGRFWAGSRSGARDQVFVAHRFAYAIAYGAAALNEAPALVSRCGNPLCQNVEHLVVMDEREAAAQAAGRRRAPLAQAARAWALSVREAVLAGRAADASFPDFEELQHTLF